MRSVEVLSRSIDRVAIASWPVTAAVLVELGLHCGDKACCFPSALEGAGETLLGGVEISTAVRRDARLELGEFGVEMPVGDAERRDAVRKGLVDAYAGEGDVGPVQLEALQCVFHGLATPAVNRFVLVVGGLVSG